MARTLAADASPPYTPYTNMTQRSHQRRTVVRDTPPFPRSGGQGAALIRAKMLCKEKGGGWPPVRRRPLHPHRRGARDGGDIDNSGRGAKGGTRSMVWEIQSFPIPITVESLQGFYFKKRVPLYQNRSNQSVSELRRNVVF